MKKLFYSIAIWFIPLLSHAQKQSPFLEETLEERDKLPGFIISPYFEEQEMAFVYSPGVKVYINAPSIKTFDKQKPTKLVLYALPNGNTTEWTIGKLPAKGDDWHYHIQHIGAQTRYIRANIRGYNLVTIYLEANTKSWGAWRKTDSRRDPKIKEVVEYLFTLFSDYNPHIELNSHSGGGNFIFGFMDACLKIPTYVKKISFIDSNYNWDDKRYGEKLIQWLKTSPENGLFVACYDDANALLNGKSFVSKTGGTWHRTYLMKRYLKKRMKHLKWSKISDDSIIYYTANQRMIQFYSRRNPERRIYHTILVERNGYIQSILSGTEQEGKNYQFMGKKAYDIYRQDSVVLPHLFQFPPRKKEAMSGSEFANQVLNMTAEKRDSVVYKEIAEGNIPDSFRQPIYVTDSLSDSNGKSHEVTLCLLPDFLAIGNDNNFLRIPMLSNTAQRLADLYGSTLPTRKISDLIHKHSQLKFTPHPMTPDSTMVTIPIFVRHDSIINKAHKKIKSYSCPLSAGHKKDIVISNRITEEPGRLFIYGWHYQNGEPIQPLSAAHSINYVDYSHGVRLIRDEVLVDRQLYSLRKLLQDPILYKLFSDESKPMTVPRY